MRFIKFEFDGTGLPGHKKSTNSEWNATDADMLDAIQALEEELRRRGVEKKVK